LNLHGVIVPAATGMGDTLALFMRHLPAAQQPEVIDEEAWDVLPVTAHTARSPRGRRGVLIS